MPQIYYIWPRLRHQVIIFGLYSFINIETISNNYKYFYRNSAIANALAERGHNVTYFSPDKDKKPAQNVHNILIEKVYDGFYQEFVKGMFENEYLPPYMEPYELNRFCIPICEGNSISKIKIFLHNNNNFEFAETLKTNGFRQLLSYPDDFKFDLVLYDFTMGPCVIPFLHKFNYPPLVAVTAYSHPSYVIQLAGGNHYYSYVPHNAFTYHSDMTLWQRIYNFAVFSEDYL